MGKKSNKEKKWEPKEIKEDALDHRELAESEEPKDEEPKDEKGEKRRHLSK